MGQLNKLFVEDMLRSIEAGKFPNLTLWEFKQLGMAWQGLHGYRTWPGMPQGPRTEERTFILLATEKGLTPVGKLVDALQAFVVAEDDWRHTKSGMPEGTFDDALSDAYTKAKAALEQFTMYADNIAVSPPRRNGE